ncbi:hypothetical protein [Pectobacterium brasiliense]|nr:hypothetical protein [Pectobacterium brasiliense]
MKISLGNNMLTLSQGSVTFTGRLGTTTITNDSSIVGYAAVYGR